MLLKRPIRVSFYFAFMGMLLPWALAIAVSRSVVPIQEGVENPASSAPLVVPAGERILLRLENALHTQTVRQGDQARFTTLQEIYLGEQHALPSKMSVQATITQSKRRSIFRRASIRLRFDDLVFPDGSAIPFSARIVREGHTDPLQAYRLWVNTAGDADDLEWPAGMTVEVELTENLVVPVQLAALFPWEPSPAARVPAINKLPVEGREVAKTISSEETTLAGVQSVGDATPAGVALSFAAPPGTPRPALEEFKLRVDVGLVLIEATVLNQAGFHLTTLTGKDFRVFEDGVEQRVKHFSRDKFPLAVALVMDSSESIAPYVDELRRVTNLTLGQLKAADQLALFSFAGWTQRLEGLTSERRRLTDRIDRISVRGSTNVADAVFDVARYLKMASPGHRHAIILISDNGANVLGRASESGAIRMALEAETVVYNIKVGTDGSARYQMAPTWIGPSEDFFDRVTTVTGGEIIDVESIASLESALATAVSRLKLRYTLGYSPTNKSRDGRFRNVQVRLAGQFDQSGQNYTIRARRGYFAPSNTPRQ